MKKVVVILIQRYLWTNHYLMLIIFHSQLIIYSTYSLTLLGRSWIIPHSIHSNYARFCVPYCKVLPDCYKWLFTYLSPNYINKYLNTHTSKYFTSEVLKGFFLSFSSVSNVLNLPYIVLYIFFVVFFLIWWTCSKWFVVCHLYFKCFSLFEDYSSLLHILKH